MDGFASDWMRHSLSEGRFVFPAPPPKTVQVVALADPPAVVTLVFEQPSRFAGQRLEIASDELAGPQMAHVLSEVTGRPVTHVAPPPEALG
jgi:uncharacterized protein YbjT (DUF2867 family)